jgi:hypothetical protein
MKLFKKKGVVKSWKDVTLEQGIELSQLDIEDSWELVTNQMAIILDTTMDEIENKPAALVYEFINDWAFIKEMPPMKELKHFKVDGQWYKLINLSEMTLAQMVDIEEYYKLGLMNNIHKILSVLYLPASKNLLGKWTLSEYEPDEKRENIFLKMDMESIWGTTLFFWIGVQNYMSVFKDYLKMEEMKMMSMNKVEE